MIQKKLTSRTPFNHMEDELFHPPSCYKTMTPKLLILVGPPCIGKSTYAKTRVKDNFYIVSRDNFRESLFGEYRVGSKQEEGLVTDLVKMTATKLLTDGHNVILDNTHLKEVYINKAVEDYNHLAEIYVVFMSKVETKELLRRNNTRHEKTGKFIPEDVITSMNESYSNLLAHTYSGRLYYPKK